MKQLIATIATATIAIASIACATTETEPVIASEPVVQAPAEMVIDLYEKVIFQGCFDSTAKVNDVTYHTNKVTVNVHLHGHTMTKTIVCGNIDGSEGYWIESGNMWRFQENPLG